MWGYFWHIYIIYIFSELAVSSLIHIQNLILKISTLNLDEGNFNRLFSILKIEAYKILISK